MGLFTRQPMQLKQNLPYTLSANVATKLIIGLGNPGTEYQKTRHNIGFMVLDEFARQNDFSDWQESPKFQGLVCEKRLSDKRVFLLKPQTFMNLSGRAAQSMAHFFKINLADIAAVYDDLTIPFGQIRTRTGGQSGGHNGIKSLVENIGSDFGRIKVGTKNDIAVTADQSDFVLAKFSKNEQAQLPKIVQEAGLILTEFIYSPKLGQDTRKIIEI